METQESKTKTYSIKQNDKEVMSITITQPAGVTYNDIIWDSKTGMVSAIIDGVRKPIPFEGQSYGKLDPTGFTAYGF
jgi:hypothetical protein